MTTKKRLRLVIVSERTRAHFQVPLHYFRELDIYHLYARTFNDFNPNNFGERLIRYENLRDLLKKLAALHPDVIQGLEPTYGASKLLVPWRTILLIKTVYGFAQAQHIPYFFHVLENIPPRQRFGPVIGPWMRSLITQTARAAAFVFAINRGAEMNLLAAGVPPEKIIRGLWGIWGVDVRRYAPGKKADQPLLLFVGRLSHQKGILDLVATLPALERAHPTLQTIIIGDGPLKTRVQAALHQPTIKRAQLLGHRTAEQVIPFLQQAWLLVAPARTERWLAEQVGMTNLEAMACGTPIVTTRSGSIAEFVPEAAARFVAEGQPAALEAAILELLANPNLLRRLGVAARAYAVAKYAASTNVPRLERQVLNRLGGT
ncbi:glycosyltransferase family 4 protein [Candidatus Berkelbacteria bacterium]|nr:glycosyltransferase family 4 protein [Candidatus Berkelbacteria bacterium]